MKYLKIYEQWGVDLVYDIREFFSNLKKLTYFFEDYQEIQNLFKEMSDKMELKRLPMTFFGFTTGGFSKPIVDKVASKIHILFDMVVKNDYDGIYEWCNSAASHYNYFENDKSYGIYSKLKNHISEEIAKSGLHDEHFRPYMNFGTFNSGWNKKYETKELRKIVEEISRKSKLNDKYTFQFYSSDNRIEIKIIAKERIKFNSTQLAEIEKAKEFGVKKYKHLKYRIDNKVELDDANKYNL